MKNFAGQIVWTGNVFDGVSEAIVILPSGERVTIFCESRSSMVPVKNGPFFTGESKWFIAKPDNTHAEFDSFDDLMVKGLNQPRLED